ncbi:hypothetical protein P3T21_005603 [Paraburkholderia sp. GAS334]
MPEPFPLVVLDRASGSVIDSCLSGCFFNCFSICLSSRFYWRKLAIFSYSRTVFTSKPVGLVRSAFSIVEIPLYASLNLLLKLVDLACRVVSVAAVHSLGPLTLDRRSRAGCSWSRCARSAGEAYSGSPVVTCSETFENGPHANDATDTDASVASIPRELCLILQTDTQADLFVATMGGLVQIPERFRCPP